MTGIPPELGPSNGSGPNEQIQWLSDFEPIEPKYIEYPLLQEGMFHLVAGQPKIGKGLLLARWIARCTNGEMFGEPRTALLLSSEDDTERAILPRVEVAGGDTKRIVLIPLTFQLPRDIAWLRQMVTIKVPDIALIAIDPISNHIGTVDSNAEETVRSALMPLNALAGETGIAVLGVRHVSIKGGKGTFVARILGSTAFVGVARTVIGVAPDDSGYLHVRAVTGNYAPQQESGSRFSIRSAPYRDWVKGVGMVVDAGESLVDFDSLLDDDGGGKSTKARLPMLQILDAAGGILDTEILDSQVAQLTGLSVHTLRKLRTQLKDYGLIKFQPVKNGDGTILSWQVLLTAAGRLEISSSSSPLSPSSSLEQSVPHMRTGDLQGKTTTHDFRSGHLQGLSERTGHLQDVFGKPSDPLPPSDDDIPL